MNCSSQTISLLSNALHSILPLYCQWNSLLKLHYYFHLVHNAELPWPNLTDVFLQNPDVEFFTDDSSYIHEGTWVSGAPVVSLHESVWASPLPSSYSTQVAELLVLMKADEAAGKWSTNITHAALVSELLKAIQLPSALVVIHCIAQQKEDYQVTKGYQYADATAKWLTTQPMPASVALPTLTIGTKIPFQDLLEKGDGQRLGRRNLRLALGMGSGKSQMADQ